MAEHLDLDALAELKDIMEEEFVMLLETYIVDADKKIIELADAVTKKDPKAITSVAHSLKGASSNVSAVNLAGMCKTLEHKGRDNDLTDLEACYQRIKDEYVHVKAALQAQM
ncbi:MAG: Hpt domain-containing protein [Oceanospirillaceae bacterium]|nr:Hpt domain-containing protein [Oceanospirillaceae bacterium]MCP5350074.1 Hpt domain-containing protein [Oceanospirillaceae bacterium]